jgi:nucleotide-binding universal stress UspA family protein
VTLAIVAVVLLAASLVVVLWLRRRRPRLLAPGGQRILFPFLGQALSQRALDAALRLARAEGATLVPAYLAQVPMQLSLEAPLPRQSQIALPLLEAIEQQAVNRGVSVDSRIERGRTPRQAMQALMEAEDYDRMVVAAATNGSDGFSGEDVAWLLNTVPAEIVVLRPALSRG